MNDVFTLRESDNEDDFAFSESKASDESTDDRDSDDDSDDSQLNVTEPCKYYNKGHCREGDRCLYLHVCKFALRGNCRHGSRCKLKHPRGRRQSSPTSSGASERSTSREIKITDGRCYQWQLNDGTDWKDVDNDHIIEAQYCLPHSKSIKIYNTPYGAVTIDLDRMRVCGKSLRVRRLDDGNTVWTWFCTLSHKWIKYGDKDSKGNVIPVKSSDIEQQFQSDPSSSFTFNVGADTLEIKFREMRQVSTNRVRKVARRPLYRQRQAGAGKRATKRISKMLLLQSFSSGLSFAECFSEHQTTMAVQGIRWSMVRLQTQVSGKHYEWQLSDGRQWLTIDNDHVIETHYCQPGAKGITIDTDIQGQVFIDFDKLQTRTSTLSVQRLSVVPQGQTEDVGWYFRDDQLWREYGSQGSSMLASSVSSGDVERQFALNPQGTFRFTVGSTGYRLDFSAMTQTNCITGLCRNIRRRPKFTPNSGSSGATPRWQFQDICGIWKDYSKANHRCSVSSRDIELLYTQNQSGKMSFTTKNFSYELDFSAMTQRNLSTNTSRPVRRLDH
ncbi:hypothetical protein F2P81_018883 [Scophthalmus maximus]|uniref:Uncharacterized protein n=1 Tax=Scophthalmus maximus TaxID=52904 RepID=A0A6A4SBU9_SCOMX|nr:hypothetical protein F2P81_018883 [Scophthalmus maximus]